MKEITYTLVVKHQNTPDKDAWKESITDYVDDSFSPEDHGRQLVNSFNDSLNPGEKPRVFISAIPEHVNDVELRRDIQHKWEKKSLVTEIGGYDKMECSICKCTGKRYGLGPTVKIDYKFRKYESECPGEK